MGAYWLLDAGAARARIAGYLSDIDCGTVLPRWDHRRTRRAGAGVARAVCRIRRPVCDWLRYVDSRALDQLRPDHCDLSRLARAVAARSGEADCPRQRGAPFQ